MERELFFFLVGVFTPVLLVVIFLGLNELREVYFQYKWIKRSPELKAKQLKEIKEYKANPLVDRDIQPDR